MVMNRRSTGGYVCLASFLYNFLAGKSVGYPLVISIFLFNHVLTSATEDLTAQCVPTNYPRRLLPRTSRWGSVIPRPSTRQTIVGFQLTLFTTTSLILLPPGAFTNDTAQPSSYNYIDPSVPFEVNGISDPTSQRFHDTCQSSFVVPIPDTPAFAPG